MRRCFARRRGTRPTTQEIATAPWNGAAAHKPNGFRPGAAARTHVRSGVFGHKPAEAFRNRCDKTNGVMTATTFYRRAVAVLCALALFALLLWLGMQLHFVRERERFFADKRNMLLSDPFVTATGDIPWIWTALGARKYSNYIPLPRDRFTADDLSRIRSLFPECKVELVPEEELHQRRKAPLLTR